MDHSGPLTRCGIDSVEIARMERLLRETPQEDLLRIFSPQELKDAGDGGGRVASMAARFAAKEACLKLFPRETALGQIGPEDFVVAQDGYGAPHLVPSEKAQELLDRYRLKGIAISLTHHDVSASAVAVTEPAETHVPLVGKFIYYLLPIRRRVVLSNLRLVLGGKVSENEIMRLAQAFYAHMARFLVEFLRFSWLSRGRRAALVRVENVDAILRAHAQGKGVLLLTGHLGNWELATVAGLANFPQHRGRFHIPRKPLHPRWLDALVTGRFRRGGLGVLPKKGALEAILDRLAVQDVVVFILDQHAGGRDGVEVEFFGHKAKTFRSLATIALATGAPVVPAASWREPDGHHVLRFEEALPVVECDDPGEAIRANTRAYNAALERLILRHPEQWFWMHRRWKNLR
ncbi:MAG: 4'-phosphopantetheinyl transferase superfamily protein [candidate division NC10 bacterium]|nr:4'-phosphopantetheinyl transferase superfamily protein [candidate division NC10 bacterium]MCZ6549988.1 4'-phosphopantetheinyl transferase superfamily protein [candidate division NC10 bacterium]